jgi:urease accessory protein
MRAVLTVCLLIAFPSIALAHTGAGHADGLLHGFSHPIGGIDHVLAMVAVGVLAFVLGGRALLLVPLSFVGMMVLGFAAGVSGFGLPYVEVGIAVSAIVIGGAAALGRPMPLAVAMGLVGTLAVFHGHAHGTEMGQDLSGLAYAAGFVAATALLHAAGIGVAAGMARLTGRFGRPLAQLAGALFALGGAGVLAGWL